MPFNPLKGNFKGVTRLATRLIDKSTEVIRDIFGFKKGPQAFHMFIFLLNMVLSSVNIVLFFKIDADIHITFWMGDFVRYLNLGVPIILLGVSLHLFILNCCRCSVEAVRSIIFTVFLVAGVVLLAGSMYVTAQAFLVHNELEYTCGESKLTKAVQDEWQRLNDFRAECATVQGLDTNDIYVQQCPEFEAFAKENEVMVEYIETMEYDYSCQGFCHFFEHPLFNTEGSSGERCASSVATDVLDTGIAIGIPAFASALVTMCLGQVLAQYEHL